MQQKRKVMSGYGEGGIPLWLLRDLKYLQFLGFPTGRHRRRLIRMLKVQSAQFDRILAAGVGEVCRSAVLKFDIRQLKAKIASLESGEEVGTLMRERNHWKANHDHQVQVNRLLRDRPDLGERARLVAHLMQENDQLRARLQPGAST